METTTKPTCTSVIGTDHGRPIECGAPLVSRWLETVTCEHGHVERFNPGRWSDDDE